MLMHMSKVSYAETNGDLIEAHGDYRILHGDRQGDFRCAIIWKERCLDPDFLPQWTLLGSDGEFDDQNQLRQIPWFDDIESREQSDEAQNHMVLGPELTWATD